ncbi:MAG: hypothetical protein ACJAS1_001749 [Oleiphilaceae bacterium]|jgi:hypothetical protein
MHIEAMTHTLKILKLYGMACNIEELARQDAPAYERVVPILSALIKAESTDREVRSIAYQMKAAKFPV